MGNGFGSRATLRKREPQLFKVLTLLVNFASHKRISSPGQYHLQSCSLQHSHTSAFGAVIAGNSSGRRVLECLSGDSPFLPELLQLK
ncbi:hypothetical protein TNCV_1490031 [Trichonephila clavipes]|nr:hypothetical protein TNCV_1490031 [Trichonephila clavipes]